MATNTPPLSISRTAGVRQTEPSGYNPYATGGLGNIARRGVDRALDVSSPLGVAHIVGDSPVRLLKLLPDLHPAFDKELWNVINLACAPGDLKVSAVFVKDKGEEADEEGTASLDALWSSLPSEVGGLHGLQRQLIQEAMLTGLPCVEAVPGKIGAGVVKVCPVDSLTIAFRRDEELNLVPRQRQVRSNSGVSSDGFKDLDPRTFFWRAMNAMVDQPYGRAPFGVALNECLADIAMLKDLRDAIHLTGHPRMAQGFDFQEMVNLAVQQGKTLEEAGEWAYTQFLKAQETAAKLRADDVLLHDKNADVKVLEGGKGFTGLEPVLVFLRHRITMALKTMPTLMGINDGSTQTYTTVEWAIYAAGLETARGIVGELLWLIAALHLRLSGRTSVPKVKTNPIRTTDNFVEAQTLALRISNTRTLMQMGMISPEEAAKELTGSAPYDLALAKAVATQPISPPPAVTGDKAASPVVFGRNGEPAKRVSA